MVTKYIVGKLDQSMFSKHTFKWLLIIFICFIVITLIRLGWIQFLSTLNYREQPIAVQGVLDLRGWKFSEKQTIRLDGEWEFYQESSFPFQSIVGMNLSMGKPRIRLTMDKETKSDMSRVSPGAQRLEACFPCQEINPSIMAAIAC